MTRNFLIKRDDLNVEEILEVAVEAPTLPMKNLGLALPGTVAVVSALSLKGFSIMLSAKLLTMLHRELRRSSPSRSTNSARFLVRIWNFLMTSRRSTWQIL